ncbi:hypothetical protein KW787_02425 [Candidatus Pacearchaeota archaeon]|nr:hypothetical protein [Candidatus Pacearchaeota archaeon]
MDNQYWIRYIEERFSDQGILAERIIVDPIAKDYSSSPLLSTADIPVLEVLVGKSSNRIMDDVNKRLKIGKLMDSHRGETRDEEEILPLTLEIFKENKINYLKFNVDTYAFPVGNNDRLIHCVMIEMRKQKKLRFDSSAYIGEDFVKANNLLSIPSDKVDPKYLILNILGKTKYGQSNISINEARNVLDRLHPKEYLDSTVHLVSSLYNQL